MSNQQPTSLSEVVLDHFLVINDDDGSVTAACGAVTFASMAEVDATRPAEGTTRCAECTRLVDSGVVS